MKYATIEYKGEEVPVLVLEDGYAPIIGCASLEDAIKSGNLAGSEERIPFDEAKLLAPIPRPSHDIICLGMNFADHTAEAARFHPNMVREDYAVYFSKRVNEAVACGGEIDSHPDITERLDYEAEVAVIIGRDAYKVSREDAGDYVFGYTIMNDVSAREVQTRHKQFYLGKSLDGFTPLGPVIVTKDEFSYPPEIGIRCRVNGETRQDGNTSQWIYGIDDVIADLSAGMTLKAGTVISMGTPAGVGMGFDPPRFLRSGDVVECEAEGIGTLTNTVR